MKIIRILIKIVLGIASILWPVTFIIVFSIVRSDVSTKNIYLMILVVLMMLSFPGLLVFYILNVYRNNRIAKNQKNLWAALLFFGNIVVYPVYWYLFIWREPKEDLRSFKTPVNAMEK